MLLGLEHVRGPCQQGPGRSLCIAEPGVCSFLLCGYLLREFPVLQDNQDGWYAMPASLTVATAMGGVIAYAAYAERDTISK